MYSAGYYVDNSYSVGYATASSPLGPFTKIKSNPVLKGNGEYVSGSGHSNYFFLPDGTEMYAVYHAHTDPSAGDRKTRDVSELPHTVQFRTTRHIDGNYTLSVKDVYRHFEDSVGAMNDFDHCGYLYEIPYRVMVRSGFGNFIAAGRVTSGEGYGWDLLRVIPPEVATGQAAGIAAALAVNDNVPVTEINISKLQDELGRRGVIIHFDDSLVRQGSAPPDVCSSFDHDHI